MRYKHILFVFNKQTPALAGSAGPPSRPFHASLYPLAWSARPPSPLPMQVNLREYNIFSLRRSPLFRRSPHCDLSIFDKILTRYTQLDKMHVQQIQGRHLIRKTCGTPISRKGFVKLEIRLFIENPWWPYVNLWRNSSIDPWRAHGDLVWVTLGQRSYCTPTHSNEGGDAFNI